mmetsp:Transcript_51228/g.116464  ORF Transcript_51228/g.116464 Transcript_51228/m.116464 type:complete len:116 (-) Transcript_51228:970-1317(-)
MPWRRAAASRAASSGRHSFATATTSIGSPAWQTPALAHPHALQARCTQGGTQGGCPLAGPLKTLKEDCGLGPLALALVPLNQMLEEMTLLASSKSWREGAPDPSLPWRKSTSASV